MPLLTSFAVDLTHEARQGKLHPAYGCETAFPAVFERLTAGAPHWVVVSGLDDQFIYLHDPDRDDEDLLFNEYDGVYIPVPHKKFIEMAKWGSKKLQAVLFVKKTVFKKVSKIKTK